MEPLPRRLPGRKHLLAVNGKVVTQGKECSPRKGYICLESEGGIVHYRNIRIRELPDSPIEQEYVAIADRGYRCLYTGVDLSGWKTEDDQWQVKDWVLSYTGDGGDDAALATEETFDDMGFIIDVKLAESSDHLLLELHGDDATAIPIHQELKGMRPLGEWNRLEGTLVDGLLTVSLNGQLVVTNQALSPRTSNGPLTLIPGGPVEIANPYHAAARSVTEGLDSRICFGEHS
ncbi:MAG: hypothetical protein R3B91_03190 [Planctomycetaceae bacterium]